MTVALWDGAGTFDHADIIGSISDSQGDGLFELLNQLNHLSLLQRSDPAADHRLAHARRLQELQLHAPIQGVRLWAGADNSSEQFACLSLRFLMNYCL